MIGDLVDDAFAAWVDRKMKSHLPYPVDRTALILVDVQRDFYPRREWIRDVADSIDWSTNMEDLVRTCRDRGAHVVHAPFHVVENDPQPGIPYVRGLAERGLLSAGSDGAELPDALVAPGDVVLPARTTLNVFYGTDLESELTARDVTHLLIVGSVANAGVDSTGRMGVELGYDVTFVSDCIAGTDPASRDASVEVTFRRMGHRVWTHDAVLGQLHR